MKKKWDSLRKDLKKEFTNKTMNSLQVNEKIKRTGFKIYIQ